MDIIVKTLLADFKRQNGLERLEDTVAFEHFTGYLVTAKHYSESFSSEEIHVGAGNDGGIDTVSIIVNGNFVTEPEEVDEIAQASQYLEVIFVFCQAETTNGFNGAKIGTFGFGVVDFFSETPTLVRNAGLKKKASVASRIFEFSGKLRKGNPDCYLYYCTTGKWNAEIDLVARKDAVVSDLRRLNLFGKIVFDAVDSSKLQSMHRATTNAIVRQINFPNKIALPDLNGISESYVGVLPATEYLKLIENDAGEIISSIFYDNVRHWQEWNEVNKGIKDTLGSDSLRALFPLLNNGITIIARRIHPTGNKVTIEDYQVVNGCQTSFVIHEVRDIITDDVLVPIRLISTEETDIRNAIIKATNRQTHVPEDQLLSLSDFPKKLENYFATFEQSKRLYYERRSRQYNSELAIEKVRIVGMQALIRSYASIFLRIPHRTTRNYRSLLLNVGDSIFGKDHKLEMYYVAAYANYRLDYMFRNNIIPSHLRPSRYHLLYLVGLQLHPSNFAPKNSHDMGRDCDKIMKSLWDESEYKLLFFEAARIVELAAEGKYHGDDVRTEPFTEAVSALFFSQTSQSKG